jgi:diaminopimelate epimerase
MGNPHAVKFLGSRQELQELDLQAAGQPVEMDTVTFPAMVNVEFAYVVSPREIDLRVWERGAGATLACGTGACATVVIAQLNDLVDTGQEIAVNLPGGTLLVRWLGEGSSVFMTGPAESVFVGQVELKI